MENIHRKDLTPLEEAQGFQRLIDEHGYTQAKLADKIGKSMTTISETLRILKLPQEILAYLRAPEHKDVNKTILLEIAKESDPKRQTELFEEAKAGNLTSRQARQRKTTCGAERPIEPSREPWQAKTTSATVTVDLHGVDSCSDQIIAALKEAIQLAEHLCGTTDKAA